MPPIIDGNMIQSDLPPHEAMKDHGYDYPGDLDLRPSSDLHKRVLGRLMSRARRGREAISRQFPIWREVDKVTRPYVRPETLSPKRQVGNSLKKVDNEDEVQLILPVAYTTLETLLTYMARVFYAPPIWKYSGTGPEDVYGAALLQALIQQQVRQQGVGLNLHTMWRDGFAYGLAPVQAEWDQTYGYQTTLEPRTFFSVLLDQVVQRAPKKVRKWGLIKEGNRLHNVSPYNFFIDPGVSVDQIQDAEFIGWMDQDTYYSLLEEENHEGSFFNVKYLKGTNGLSALRYGVTKDKYGSTKNLIGTTSRVDIMFMYVHLIPAEWGLADRDRPERWLFAVGADKVVLMAEPVDFNHGGAPVAVCAPGTDGFGITPQGMLEPIMGLQDMTDFLFNSHKANIRKVLNDMIVYDPELVNTNDLLNPGPGKLIRMRMAAWGQGDVNKAIKQLAIQDVTQQNVNEIGIMQNFVERATGASDIMQGIIQNRGPRISATMAEGATSAGASRLAKMASIISMQAMQPIGRMFASNVQQFMERETYVQMSGEMLQRTMKHMPPEVRQKVSSGRIPVDPEQLLIHYDLEVSDSVMPGLQNPNTWVELFQFMLQSQNPQITQSVNFVGMFTHIAKMLGAYNIDDFILTPMDNDQVDQQLQAGNLIPAVEPSGGGDGATVPAGF